MAKLSERHKRFCDEYLIDLNVTQAAIRAGYTPKYANKKVYALLDKPEIKEYLDQQLKKIEDEKIADAKEVMQYLTSVMRNEATEEVVVVEGCGDGCSETRIVKKDMSAKDRNKAAELLGKRYRLFTEKVEVTGTQQVQIVDDIE
ncbi:terminase small subunit [Clostridium botulinum]|uniref:terminase small subunit n=1 Tax=Clostridium botulinum TaxID=1491 RepID=UPI0021B38916|nr:terminase small subunit [Clostridium botulinum]UZP04381.1 terminase small subunit [Clostridium botulinum]UZP07739.1 terminase small subunit [Clostridium botulinum]UZP07793.1 terminase small subunit [Clostridium botulinum]UZP11120.1 terminase small subunit [Clostridium botulinum]